jgi:putative superfamily III holin-X
VSTNGTASLKRRHLGELVGQLASDAGTLVRQEVELAKAELRETADSLRKELSEASTIAQGETTEKIALARHEVSHKASSIGKGAGMYGAAAALALLALGALTACLVLALDRFMPTDLAALVVTVGWALLAATFALLGRDRIRHSGTLHTQSWLPRQAIAAFKNVGSSTHVVPTETIETVKEDVQWVKTRGRSDAR